MSCNLLFRPPRFGLLAAAMIGWLGVSPTAEADNVPLQQATATFSQAAFFGPSRAINTEPSDGWAICHCHALDPIYGNILAETAVFETVTDLGFVPSTSLTFTFDSHWGPDDDGPYIIGRFRLSVTTDDRSKSFADGLDGGLTLLTMEQIPGDVSANWTVLNPTGLSATEGVTLTELSVQETRLLATTFQTSPGPASTRGPHTPMTAKTCAAKHHRLSAGSHGGPEFARRRRRWWRPWTHSEGASSSPTSRSTRWKVHHCLTSTAITTTTTLSTRRITCSGGRA